MEEKCINTKMSTEEKQVLLLRRRWDVIEVAKNYRFKTPIVVCGLLLAVTGFVMQSKTLPATMFHKYAITAVLFTVTIVGVMTFYAVHELYNQFFKQIDYLYKQLGISGDKYFATDHKSESKPIKLFRAGYIVIIVVGIVCSTVVSMEPLKITVKNKDNLHAKEQIASEDLSNFKKLKKKVVAGEGLLR